MSLPAKQASAALTECASAFLVLNHNRAGAVISYFRSRTVLRDEPDRGKLVKTFSRFDRPRNENKARLYGEIAMIAEAANPAISASMTAFLPKNQYYEGERTTFVSVIRQKRRIFSPLFSTSAKSVRTRFP